MVKVHLLDTLDDKTQVELEKQLEPGVDMTSGPELPEQPDYEILVAGRPEREHLAASPDLKALIIPWAGVPGPTRQLAAEFPDLTVHNLHHNAAPTAELALALLFSAAKYILPFDQALRQGNWERRYRPSPALLMAGKQVLILGLGEIGRRIAKVCLALDMQVIAIRRHPDQVPPGLEEISIQPLEKLSQLLPTCQILMIALPLTPETQGLIGAEALQQMPSGSILVNIGRGPIVDQAALYRSLVRGKLAAAGLDVWYNYPRKPEDRLETMPSDAPLYRLSNVVLSPHRGGASLGTEKLRMQHLARLLNTANRAEPIPNRVNLNLGY